MKKIMIYSLVFGFLLTGCSKPEITESKIMQTDGIYNYYQGKTNKKIKNATVKTQNGTVYDGQVNNNEFMTSSPALISNENVHVIINFENGNKIEQDIDFPKRNPIDSYIVFANKMNFYITQINPNAKTQFPSEQSNGTAVVASENNVTSNVNVQDGKLVGLNMSTPGDANQELATIVVAFQTAYGDINNGISEAYNNTLETKEENSFSADGYLYTFCYNGNNLVADIIKE